MNSMESVNTERDCPSTASKTMPHFTSFDSFTRPSTREKPNDNGQFSASSTLDGEGVPCYPEFFKSTTGTGIRNSLDTRKINDSGFFINNRIENSDKSDSLADANNPLPDDSLAINTSFDPIDIEPPHGDPEALILPWIILAGLMLIPKSAGRKAEQSSMPVEQGMDDMMLRTGSMFESTEQIQFQFVESMTTESSL